MRSHRKCHTAGGMPNSTTTLEDRWMVSYKTKHTLTTQPGNRASGDYLLGPHRKRHTDVYNSFIHKCQTLEATRSSLVGKRINKPWYIQTTTELLFTLKKGVSYQATTKHRETLNAQ